MGMLEQLIITLREGIEAALIIAIALAYLRKVGRADLIRMVYIALLSALGVSLGGAILLTRMHLSGTGFEDRFEGWLMLIAAVFVFTMVYWMSKASKHIKQEIEQSMARNTSALGIFLFVFFMVLREGVETVLMLTAVSLNSTELMAWLGSVLGLALAILFAIAFVKGSIRINLGRFFRLTTVILFVIAGQLMLTGVHELSESGVLPSSRTEMAMVGPIVRNDVFFFIVVLGLATFLLIRERQKSLAAAAAAQGAESESSAAMRRKAASSARAERRWNVLAWSAALVFMVLISADYIYARNARALSPAVQVEASNGVVELPVSQVADGMLHRYEVATPDGGVRFFAIRRPDGSIAVNLDACQICGPLGYYQRGNMLYCRNCDAPINVSSLGAVGGCNPIPLRYQQVGSNIRILISTLAAEAPVFRQKQ